MKKNILISVYDMEIGGIERSLINMLRSFDYESYNIDLLIYEHKGDLLHFIPNKVNILPQVNAYSVFRKPIKQCVKEGYFTTSLMRIFAKHVANVRAKKRQLNEGSAYIQMQLALRYSKYFLPRLKNEYDVAISYAWPHDIIANKVMAKKKIAWIHTDYSKLEVDYDIDFKTWNQFDHIGSVSEECTNAFLSTYPLLKNKLFQMENINSPSLIRKMANEKVEFQNAIEETFKLVSVGRLSYAKGFDIAVRALKKLHDNDLTCIKWYVVGYGPEEAHLKDQIKEYGLTDSFILLGKKQNPYPYIKRADLYVQPSRYEGKAVTVTEAKILGKPIIITKYSTAKSQVSHDFDGFMTELSIEGLVKAIERLYQDKKLRNQLSINCQNSNYSNVDELTKLYYQLEGINGEHLDLQKLPIGSV